MRSAAAGTLTLLGALLLGGCATPGTTTNSEAAPSAAAERSAARVALAERLGGAQPGATLATEGALPGHDEVVAGRLYTAASGRRCRVLRDAEGQVLDWLACEREGSWSMNDALISRAAPTRPLAIATVAPAEPSIAAARSGASPAPTTEFTLQHGESLWAFAARVTDDPLHWRQIAEHNGIADGSVVQGGRRLDVPLALLD